MRIHLEPNLWQISPFVTIVSIQVSLLVYLYVLPSMILKPWFKNLRDVKTMVKHLSLKYGISTRLLQPIS